VEIPGVGAGIGFDPVETKVGVADGVGEAVGETIVVEVGVGLAVGEGEALGDAVGVGITIGIGEPLDFFLTQTNFPDLARHSKSVPLFFAVRPTFLQVAPLFTAACEGATTTKERKSPRTTIQEREERDAFASLLRRTITLPRALDMLPSCPTVYP
jgi:hypothetical protein